MGAVFSRPPIMGLRLMLLSRAAVAKCSKHKFLLRRKRGKSYWTIICISADNRQYCLNRNNFLLSDYKLHKQTALSLMICLYIPTLECKLSYQMCCGSLSL